MKKIPLLPFAALALPALVACGPAADGPASETEEELIARAQGIHERVITIDTHIDISTRNFTPEQNYTMDLDTRVNLPKMEAGGLDVAWFVVYVGQGEHTEEAFDAAYQEAIAKFDAIHWLAEEAAPDRIELAYTSDDVKRIAGTGKKVAMIGVENGYSIGTDLSRIQEFHERGARYLSLSHNGHSQLADSNTGERDDVWLHGGLSDLGRQAVAELNRWGIMIDLSHPSQESNAQTIELSRAPVIASHSSARALSPVSRNLYDEELLAIAENGGVVQAVALGSYVNQEKVQTRREALSALRAEVAEEMGFELLERSAIRQLSDADLEAYYTGLEAVEAAVDERAGPIDEVAPPVDVADFVDHIDYMVELMGIDHVGISSDFDGGGGVLGWNDASETFGVTLELVRRGYTEEEIVKLWGGNLLRVLDEVQEVAGQIQAEG